MLFAPSERRFSSRKSATGMKGNPPPFRSPFTKLSYNLFIYLFCFSFSFYPSNDLINDTLADFNVWINWERYSKKTALKKRKRRRKKILALSKKRILPGKKNGWISNEVWRGEGSRYLERIRFYCQHGHKLEKNTFGRGVARTPSRIEAIYERRLSKYPWRFVAVAWKECTARNR